MALATLSREDDFTAAVYCFRWLAKVLHSANSARPRPDPMDTEKPKHRLWEMIQHTKALAYVPSRP